MQDDHATVLSHLSDLRADHPYLINIEHMFLGMMSPEKDDDTKYIRYHNRSVGEDESGIDVRRSLKAYSAFIRDDDDYIEDLDNFVAASMYGVNIAIIECYKDVVVTPADGNAPNQEKSTTTPADSQCWKPYVTILAPLPIGDHGGDAPDSVINPLFELKQARNSSRPTIVIARVSDNHYCAVAPRLHCCAGDLCKMKGTLKQEAWLILCDVCNQPIHAECCAVSTEVGVAPVYFGMRKSFSTGRSCVVGKDDDDDQEDGGVATNAWTGVTIL
jgi:hypothetical protein